MNILYLSSIGAIGGAERALLDLLAALKAAHPDWRLSLVAGSEGALIDEARSLGAAPVVLPMPSAIAKLGDAREGSDQLRSRVWGAVPGLLAALPYAVVYARTLRRVITEADPDIVHSNGFKMHLLGAWATPPDLPLLWHIHDYVTTRSLMSQLLPPHSRRCALMIANSKSVADDAARLMRRVRVLPVHNAVDLRRYAPKGAVVDLDRLSGMPPMPEGGVRVGLIATMAHWKGHTIFLNALATLPRTVPVRGYVIGGPIYRTVGSQRRLDELRALATSLGLVNRVGFTGFVADSAAAMRALDVVVHASTDPEPFGLVIAEAMACGRALIASGAGGANELVEDGVSALVHPPGDADALCTLIARLANDHVLRVRLGNSARASAERLFTRERMASEIAPIYQELAARAA